MYSLVGTPPDTDTTARARDEGPGLPLSPGSSERQATASEVTAPAEAPPTAMRSVSIR